MATKLQCEICGGKLVGKPGGIFECENCGTEYSTEWAKAKIQEIRGTVKVEGTVEVTGKVQIDGPVKVEGGANKEALLQRGMMALEDQNWERAKELFNQVLNYDATCGVAYLGLGLAELKFKSREHFQEEYTAEYSHFRPARNSDLLRCMQYDPELKQWFEQMDKAGLEADANRFAEQKKQAEEFERKEKELNSLLPAARRRVAPFSTWLAVGHEHLAALREDGRVIAGGSNSWNQCEVSTWRNIVALSAGQYHTVGLCADRTVVATKAKNALDCSTNFGQSEVSSWKNIVAVAAGRSYTLGLKADGSVLSAGLYYTEVYEKGRISLQTNAILVNGWENIVAIAAGCNHCVGLTADGKVVASGSNSFGQCNVGDWTDIISIAAGAYHTVGLRADGTVLTAGSNQQGQCNVSWKNIVAISAGGFSTLGLRLDGTVWAVGLNNNGECYVDDWKDVVAICGGWRNSCALLKNGGVKTAGKDSYISFDWKAFDQFEAIVKKNEQKCSELRQEKASLTAELANLTGMFSKIKKAKIQSRLAEIEAMLWQLGQGRD